MNNWMIDSVNLTLDVGCAFGVPTHVGGGGVGRWRAFLLPPSPVKV